MTTGPLASWPDLPEARIAALGALCCASGLATAQRPWATGLCACAALGAAWADGALGVGGLAALTAFGVLCMAQRLPKVRAPWPLDYALMLRWLQWWAAGLLMVGIVPGFGRSIWPTAVRIKEHAVLFDPEYRLQHVLVAALLALGSGASWPRQGWRGWALWGAALPTAGVLAALMPLALWAHKVAFAPVRLSLVPLFALHNVALVVLPEEILFRGTLFGLLERTLPKRWAMPAGVCVVSAVVFGIAHLPQGPLMAALSLLAGLGYGAAFVRTGGLGGAVIAHAAVNLVHFALFSYPSLP